MPEKGPRRGSSIFANPAAVGGAGRGTAAPQGGGSAVDGRHRGSVVLPSMTPGGGVGFGLDFDDSDYDDSDDEDVPHGGPHGGGGLPGSSMPGAGGSTAGRGAGGPNHRPLVGGFAAAAYEAARDAHYKEQQRRLQGANGAKPNQTSRPPSAAPRNNH
eukprot:scaffold22671_cov164-Cylindrotheca_fusiformis.AAC.1